MDGDHGEGGNPCKAFVARSVIGSLASNGDAGKEPHKT